MLASGGSALASGIALVGERGREIMDMRGATTRPLPSKDSYNTNDISKQPAIIQVVTPDKQIIASWLVDEITDKQQFILDRSKMF